MAYQVIDIEGIVVAYANKLITEEIKTVDDLLQKTKPAKKRAKETNNPCSFCN